MKIAYFDCFSGVSGDMLLGSLIDAGWDPEELKGLPRRLGLTDVEIEISRVTRGFLEAAKVDVHVGGPQPARHLTDVLAILRGAELPDRTRTRAGEVFERLAEAEAQVHGTTPEEVHFHEVGAADALVDVTGACLGLERLGVDAVYSSALPLGRGTVRAQHGVIPVPAPATARLLRGVPVEMPDIEAELVTPTGAAILVTVVDRWGYCPSFTLSSEGLGAGGRDLDEQPNALRLFLGETGETLPGSKASGFILKGSVSVLETAIDDAPPQYLAPLLPRLLDAGALDAFLTAIVMKKGRPALLLTCLCRTGEEEKLARLIFQQTPTLGIRHRREERFELSRRQVEVKTPFGMVEAKVATLPDGSERLMPEYESVARVAEERGISLLDLSRVVASAWESNSI
jgi:uncharacterized protein (TIGR00299 family) protein